MLTLTDHEKGDYEVFPASGLHSTEHRPHHGTADTHQGDQHDEPADGDCLGGCQATARLTLGLILYQGLNLDQCNGEGSIVASTAFEQRQGNIPGC